MVKYALFAIILINTSLTAFCQVPKKRLPQNINVPMYSHIFPSLSGDGTQMFYLTDYTNSEGFELKYTYKTGSEIWADPEAAPQINRVGLDHIGSFCFSYDGNFVVFSSRRSPGIGNYDIWISEKTGNNWSTPINPGKPLNSAANEGNPSLSPDGKSIYFMRCESMDNFNKNNCSLYVSHKISEKNWSEPEALPENINSGHETTPRIMADNSTLLFASGRSGGKGMLDLYSSTFENDAWTDPIPLDFINTDKNDEYVSVPARGDLIYFGGPYRDQQNLYKAIIPEELRPNKVLMLVGTVSYTDGNYPVDDILIQAFDVATGEIFTTTKLKTDDHSFTLFLPEGKTYDISAFPIKGGHTFYGSFMDLNEMTASRREDISMTLESIEAGTIIPSSTIIFEPNTAELSDESNTEIRRIIGLLKKNPGIRLEIGAYINQVLSDSVPSETLTQVIADTVFIQISNEITSVSDDEIIQDDSVLFDNAESELFDDVSESEEFTAYDDFLSEEDSISQAGFVLFDSGDMEDIYFKINYTYHNDQTEAQAEALMQKLISLGVPSNLLESEGYGDDWTTDRSSDGKDYWIELKIIED